MKYFVRHVNIKLFLRLSILLLLIFIIKIGFDKTKAHFVQKWTSNYIGIIFTLSQMKDENAKIKILEENYKSTFSNFKALYLLEIVKVKNNLNQTEDAINLLKKNLTIFNLSDIIRDKMIVTLVSLLINKGDEKSLNEAKYYINKIKNSLMYGNTLLNQAKSIDLLMQ